VVNDGVDDAVPFFVTTGAMAASANRPSRSNRLFVVRPLTNGTEVFLGSRDSSPPNQALNVSSISTTSVALTRVNRLNSPKLFSVTSGSVPPRPKAVPRTTAGLVP
jgi:hypothetical protein